MLLLGNKGSCQRRANVMTSCRVTSMLDPLNAACRDAELSKKEQAEAVVVMGICYLLSADCPLLNPSQPQSKGLALKGGPACRHVHGRPTPCMSMWVLSSFVVRTPRWLHKPPQPDHVATCAAMEGTGLCSPLMHLHPGMLTCRSLLLTLPVPPVSRSCSCVRSWFPAGTAARAACSRAVTAAASLRGWLLLSASIRRKVLSSASTSSKCLQRF